MSHFKSVDITEQLINEFPEQFSKYPKESRIVIPEGWRHDVVNHVVTIASIFPMVRYTEISDKHGSLILNHNSNCGISIKDAIESAIHVCCDQISAVCVKCGTGDMVEIDPDGDDHYAYCNLHTPIRKNRNGKIEKQLIYLYGGSRSSGS
jgi:hypothetical protein